MDSPRGYGFNPKQLVRIRKQRGLSQRQLAINSGLARIGIARYEQGLAEPRMDSVQAIARELEVEPRVFFEWPEEKPAATAERPPDKPPSSKKPKEKAAEIPGQTFAQNMALLNQFELGTLLQGLSSLQAFMESLTTSDNPLDYDQDLYDRELVELQQTTPSALREARSELGLSVHDLSKLSGLSSERLTEIETKRGMPVQPSEIFELRKTLGVRYEPRAIATRSFVLHPGKDRRSARAKFHDSVQEWERRCRRTPNKLDKLDLLLQRVAGLEKRLGKIESDLKSALKPPKDAK